jgi:hypothetical protein
MKKTQRQLMQEWARLSDFQKARWNGFRGYCKGEKFNETSRFIGKRSKRFLQYQTT